MNIMKPYEPTYPSATPHLAEDPPFHWLVDLVSFFRRRWPLMVGSVAIVVAAGMAYALTSTPRFTAEASLLFDIRRADLLRQQGGGQDSQTLNAVLESQVEMLRSEGLARKAVERLGLTKDRHFVTVRPGLMDWLRSLLPSVSHEASTSSGPEDQVSRLAQQLSQMLTVRRVGQTYVMTVSATSPSADEAAWLVNGVMDAYIADQLEAKEDSIAQATGWLQIRIKDLRDQALAADRAVQDYKAQHNIVDTDRGLMGSQQLSELSSQLVGARASSEEKLARLQRIDSITRDGVGSGSVTDGLDNKVIVALRQQYVDDDRRVADLSAKLGNDHIAVRNLRSEMAEIKKSIQNELGRIAETYKSDYEVARANEASLQLRLDQMVAAAAQTNNDLVVLRSLESSAETYRSLYENFLQRYTQAVQDQSFPVPEARVITSAVAPKRKSEPKTTIILALSAVFGATLGFAVALIREALDRGIRTPDQLRAATGLNCIGMIPRLKSRERRRALRDSTLAGAAPASRLLSQRSIGLLRYIVETPRSAFADSVRGVRMRILSQRLRSREIKVIGCVANRHGAGTSTVAANLAQLIAQSGARTILLDWDFLHASLSRELTGDAGFGCLDVLKSGVPVETAIWRDEKTDLRFLPAGSRSLVSSAARTVSSEAMHDLLSDLRGDYSHVVVDLPSLSTVSDAHFAVHMLDATVLVTEWGQPDHEGLLENLVRIGLDETSILGVVLNKANLKRQWSGCRSSVPDRPRVDAEAGVGF